MGVGGGVGVGVALATDAVGLAEAAGETGAADLAKSIRSIDESGPGEAIGLGLAEAVFGAVVETVSVCLAAEAEVVLVGSPRFRLPGIVCLLEAVVSWPEVVRLEGTEPAPCPPNPEPAGGR